MRRRTIKKNFWFSYDEDRQLKYLSNALNMSEANTIRKLLFETYVKESPPKKFYDAIDKLNKLGVNINQLTRVANSTGNIYSEKLDIYFKEIQDIILSIRKSYL